MKGLGGQLNKAHLENLFRLHQQTTVALAVRGLNPSNLSQRFVERTAVVELAADSSRQRGSYIIAGGFYGISLDLALASVRASKDLFLGIGEGSSHNGQGLDDYLNAVEAARDNIAAPLATTISSQFDLATTQLEALRPLGSLQQAIRNDINAVKLPYAAIVNQIVYLKTDLPSLLCVSITYSDITDDGD